MRKQNAEFRPSFLSHEGTQLYNNDYFGCVELDKYACYIIADGIETGDDAQSARLAVEAAAVAFTNRPSMKKKAVAGYLRQAHKALLNNPGKRKMKASITIVVTDYTSLRYGYAGNTRLHLYRSGALIRESRDHSLSWDMMEQKEIPKDRIARHEERNNLTTYLGQEDFFLPDVSQKVKLKNGDVIALLTRGVWENCDQYDLSEALADAGDDGQKALDTVERLILDSKPEGKPAEIENYTLALVYVNKIYVDPNAEKRKKRILLIIVIVLGVLLIAGIVGFLLYRMWEDKTWEMETKYISGIEYIQDDNYTKAKEEMDTDYQLAADLRNLERQNQMSQYQKLIEAVLNADELLTGSDYEGAQQAYLKALDRSKYTDNLGKQYITGKLETTSGYLNVSDLMALGDTLKDAGNYSLAEEKYLEARSLASKLYYKEGKQEAVNALTDLYEQMDEEVAAGKEQAQSEIAALDLVIQGDAAFQSNDLTSARMYYTVAREKYTQLEDAAAAASIDEKLLLVDAKETENRERLQSAAEYIEIGDTLMEVSRYTDAKKEYILAREIYSSLNEETELNGIKAKIEIADGYLAGVAAASSNGESEGEEDPI